MEITNNHNLPEEIYKAVSRAYAPNPDRFSVTDLIGPPMIRQLRIRHWAELQEDASSRLWALLGQGIHAALDGQTDATTEKKLEVKTDGITVVGKTDNYKNEVITDWKVTSVWHHIFSDNKSETAQANCYAWLWRKHGHPVKKLIIYRILRDWQQSKVGDNYPRIPFAQIAVPLWSFEEQQEYIKQQLEYHQMSNLPECTSEEKWEKPTTYAVMKKSRKSALRVLDELGTAKKWCIDNDLGTFNTEAQGAINLKAGIDIVERKGECTRCKSYCPVRAVCKFNKERK
jgi:hypothetical protein